MSNNELLQALHKETFDFFDRIFTSEELQRKYNILDYANRDFVLHTINDFRTNPQAIIVKPLYEKDYSSDSVPRSIIVQRNQYGFIVTKISNIQDDGTLIEPNRFVSIIKQLIEDENIKKEMYTETAKVSENEHSM